MAEKTIVLITGANQGCGYECAKNMLLSSSEYHIIIGSRSLSNGKEAVSNLESLPDLQGTVSVVELDVTKDESVAEAAKQVDKQFGRLDTLVNNAGIAQKQLPNHAVGPSIFDTNVMGCVRTTEIFYDLLKKSREPRIVYVSSSMGSLEHAANPESPYYHKARCRESNMYRASKAALNMLIIQFHKSLGDEEGFKIIGADPGAVATNFFDIERAKAAGIPSAAVGGGTIAEAAKGERDADLGRVVGRYGVSLW